MAEKKVELAEAKSDLDRATLQVQDRDGELGSLSSRLQTLAAEHDDLRRANENSTFERERAFRDLQAQLEATQAELVSVVNDKSIKIVQLEDAILELRKSREDLAVEDQVRFDELKAQYDTALRQVENSKSTHSRLADELRDASVEKEKSATAIARMEDELTTLTEKSAKAHTSSEKLKFDCASLRKDLETARLSSTQLNTTLSTLQAEVAIAKRGQQEARDDLDRFQKAAMENESTQTTELKSQIAELRRVAETEREAAARECGGLRKALEDEQGKLRRLEEERVGTAKADMTKRSDHEREMAVLRDQLDEASRRNDQLQSEVEAGRGSIAQLEKDRAGLDSTKNSSEEENRRLRAELENLQGGSSAALDRQRKEHEVIMVELEAAHRKLRSKLETDLASARSMLEEKDAESDRTGRKLQEEQAQTTASIVARDSLQTALDQAVQRENSLKASQSNATALELERLTKLEADLASQQARADQAVADHAQLQAQLGEALVRESSLKSSISQMTQSESSKFDSLTVEIDTQRRYAETAAAESSRLSKQLEEAVQREASLRDAQARMSSAEQTIRTQVANIKVETTKAIAEAQARAENAEREVQSCKEFIEVIEKQKAKLLLSSAKENTRERELELELKKLRMELEMLQRDHSACGRTSKQLIEAETRFKVQVEQVASLEIDSQALRQALDLAQSELALSKAKAVTSSDKAHHLAREVAELKSTSRSRHMVSTSDPAVLSRASMGNLRAQALTSAATGDDVHSAAGKLSVKEREEIERLEKVVEAQKTIIDDQRDKIKFWARVSDTHKVY